MKSMKDRMEVARALLKAADVLEQKLQAADESCSECGSNNVDSTESAVTCRECGASAPKSEASHPEGMTAVPESDGPNNPIGDDIMTTTLMGGYGYATSEIVVSLVEKGSKPFNSDTMHTIYQTFVPGTADTGEEVETSVSIGNKNSSPPMTRQQEKTMARETVLQLRIPKGADREVLKALKESLGDHFEVAQIDHYRKAASVQRGTKVKAGSLNAALDAIEAQLAALEAKNARNN